MCLTIATHGTRRSGCSMLNARVTPGGPGCGLQIRRSCEGQRLDSSSPAKIKMKYPI